MIRPTFRTLAILASVSLTQLVALNAILAQSTARPAANPAIEVLGRDFTFPHRVDGMPARLSEVRELNIGAFVTSDSVRLAYREAGQGRPLGFLPGWSRNGAHYVNLFHLLSRQYRVLMLDHRSQGLSRKVVYGTRIARFSKDVQEFSAHLGLRSADYVGHSMGAAVLWSYLDQLGGAGIRTVVFVDEPVSLYAHSDWTDQEPRDAGALVTSGEQLVVMRNAAFGARPPPHRWRPRHPPPSSPRSSERRPRCMLTTPTAWHARSCGTTSAS
jgi:non-heme chloroperoxidase